MLRVIVAAEDGFVLDSEDISEEDLVIQTGSSQYGILEEMTQRGPLKVYLDMWEERNRAHNDN